MRQVVSEQRVNGVKQGMVFPSDLSSNAKSHLTRLAMWIKDHNVPFLVTSIAMVVMLLWAGS